MLTRSRAFASAMASLMAVGVAVVAAAPSGAATSPQGETEIQASIKLKPGATMPDDLAAYMDVTDPNVSVTVNRDGSMDVTGETSQSEDPLAPAYVAPAPPAGMITPMDANGMGWIGSFSFSWNGKTFFLPAGWLTHDLQGKGLNVARESTQYGYGSPGGFQVCNVRYAFQNRDAVTSGGKVRSTHFSPPYDGCYYTQVPTYTRTNLGNMRNGLQCARFYVQGTYRGETCHAIYA